MNKEGSGGINKDKLLKHGFIILIYLLITLIISYPLIFNFTDSYVGGGDNKLHAWNMWYFKEAVLNDDVDLFFTDYVFYPYGTDLTYNISYGILNSLLAFPLLFLFDLNVVYNIIWLLSFVGSAYAAFLLSFYYTKKYLPSFIGGVIFGFCQYRMFHGLGHLAAINSFALPLFILLFMISMKKFRIRNALGAGVILAIAGLADLHYLVYLLFFMLTFFVYQIIKDRKYFIKHKRLISLAISALCFLLLFSPILIPLMKARYVENYATSPLNEMIFYSADVLSYFSIFDSNPFYGKIVGGFFREIFDHNELYRSLGYTTMFILLLGLLWRYFLKDKSLSNNQSNSIDWKFWLIIIVTFIVLSLGPYLKFMGDYDFIIFGREANILLPYYLISKLPFFDVMRTIGRMNIMVILAASVLVSSLLKEFFYRLKFHKKIIISLVIVVFFISESIFMFPYHIVGAGSPEIFLNISQENPSSSVLNLPLIFPSHNHLGISEYHREQTIHNRKMIGGFLGKHSSYSKEKTYQDHLINTVANLYFQEEDNINLRSFYFEESLKNHNIGYIIIHKNFETFYLNEEKTEAFQIFIEEYLPFQLYYEDEDMIIYSFNESKGFKRYRSQEVIELNFEKLATDLFLERWHYVEKGFRWTSTNSTIKIPIVNGAHSLKVNLSSVILAQGVPREVEIFVNGEQIHTSAVNPEVVFKRDLIIPETIIKNQELVIDIIVSPTFIPAKHLVGSNDQRKLGIPLSKIIIELTKS